jgi:hypothetical protein
MKETVHIHDDVENLCFFVNKYGLKPIIDGAISYAMQGKNIVRVFYTKEQAIGFYNENKYALNLPILYYWSQDLFNAKKSNHI